MILVLAIVVFAVIWVAVQNFGGILAGGATDPNSGLPVIILRPDLLAAARADTGPGGQVVRRPARRGG